MPAKLSRQWVQHNRGRHVETPCSQPRPTYSFAFISVMIRSLHDTRPGYCCSQTRNGALHCWYWGWQQFFHIQAIKRWQVASHLVIGTEHASSCPRVQYQREREREREIITEAAVHATVNDNVECRLVVGRYSCCHNKAVPHSGSLPHFGNNDERRGVTVRMSDDLSDMVGRLHDVSHSYTENVQWGVMSNMSASSRDYGAVFGFCLVSTPIRCHVMMII